MNDAEGDQSVGVNEGADATARPAKPATLDAIKQLDYAKDSVVQVISLSSAILAISLTFSQSFAAGATQAEMGWLKAAWIALVLAVVTGLWALLAVAGLAYAQRPDLSKWSLRLPWLLQICFFLLGLGLLVTFGFVTVSG